MGIIVHTKNFPSLFIVHTINSLTITYDKKKRDRTLAERGLNFADSAQVFAGPVLEFEDAREDYGEQRMVTVGFLGERMVMVVWTKRGDSRRIISMRYANEREKARFQGRLD